MQEQNISAKTTSGTILKISLLFFFSLLLAGCEFENLPAEREGALQYATDFGAHFKSGTVLELVDSSYKVMLGKETSFNGHKVFEATRFSDEFPLTADEKPDAYIGVFWVLTEKVAVPFVYTHLINPEDEDEKKKPNNFYVFNGTQEQHTAITEIDWVSAMDYMGKAELYEQSENLALTPKQKRVVEKDPKFRWVFEASNQSSFLDEVFYGMDEQELTTAFSLLAKKLVTSEGLINKIAYDGDYSNPQGIMFFKIIQPD